MSTINVRCTDQVLAIINSPVIASGGVNENHIQFNFCSLWDGFAKTAVFYRNKEKVYYSLVDENNTCVVPKEVTETDGKMYFGVFGASDDIVRTSEILVYTIKEGAITSDLIVSEPTPDIYNQILSELETIRELVASSGFVEMTNEEIEAIIGGD